MKTSALILAALVLAGCAGVQIPELNCETAARGYQLYAATMLVREVSDAEVRDAQRAAAFLAAVCGWQTVKTRSAGPAVDQNGVPILVAP